jgi:RNA polymerase sigma factor (sigma-70 family)
LIDHHYPTLLASCERMLPERDLARDAAQEATLRAMLGLDHLREETRFGSWLIGIGLNVCRGMLSARGRQVSLNALLADGRLGEPPADDPEPVELIAAGELVARVHAAIAALPPGQRQAVALFYIGGLTQAEAAAEIGARRGAIKTRLHDRR